MCPGPAIYYLLSSPFLRHLGSHLRTFTGPAPVSCSQDIDRGMVAWTPGNLAANLTSDLTGPPQPHAGLLTGHLTTWPSLAAGLGACLCVVFSLSRLHLSPDCGGAAAGAPEQPLATHKFESCGGCCVSAAGRMRTLNYGTRCWRPHHASLYLLHNTGDTCWLP